MREFTGERVIPGQVNDDLWAEHTARYAFASRFAKGRRRVLDVGCGTGYGDLTLSREAGVVVGIDNAPEAIEFARARSNAPNTSFLLASATALPFAARAFDLVTAFEVIEHLSDWRALLKEAARVLAPEAVFLVSTPNRLYYAESRRLHGPNPYHVHEFEFEEFRGALTDFFPNVSILFQNRIEAFAFHGQTEGEPTVHVDATTDDPENAHFFLAVCSAAPLKEIQPFIYVPRAANILREREHHIHLLETELEQTKQWLEQNIAEHKALQQAHEEQTEHLEAQNRWAMEIEEKFGAAQLRIVQLQEEAVAIATGYKAKVRELEEENRQKTEWAVDLETRLTADLAARAAQVVETVRLLDAAEQTVIERTDWARRLDAELSQLHAQLAMIRESRWIKLGRSVGLGPRLD